MLTTVSHLNRFLFDLKVHGARAPPQNLEVTGWHKLYSEDRQAWTSVCELHAGETLRGRDGPLTVESLSRHPGVERVYNLTVEDEHQYYVSAADLLAHNANCVEEQYALRARESGFYPVMERGKAGPQYLTYLNKDELWKFGTTKNPSMRYSKAYLDSIGEHGVEYNTEFTGTRNQTITVQNMKIQNYIDQHGQLPPGNKVIN